MLEEVLVLVKQLGFTYSDVMSMSVYERRFFISKYLKLTSNDDNSDNGKVTYGKNSRKTIISGDALKMKLKNNEIPDI